MIKLVVNNDTEYVAENGGQIIVEYLSDGVKGIANLNTDKAEHDIAYLNNVDRLHVKIINKEQREAIKYKNIVYLDVDYDYNRSVIKVQGFYNNEMAVLSGDYEFISDRIVDFVKILAKDVYCTVRMDCCGIGVIIKDLLEDNDIKVESIELNRFISENQKLKNLSDDKQQTKGFKGDIRELFPEMNNKIIKTMKRGFEEENLDVKEGEIIAKAPMVYVVKNGLAGMRTYFSKPISLDNLNKLGFDINITPDWDSEELKVKVIKI